MLVIKQSYISLKSYFGISQMRGYMSFAHSIKVLSVLLASLVGASLAAKPSSGIVRSVIGEITHQRYQKPDWEPLKKGNKVRQGSKVRTLLESQAIIALPDASIMYVEENSLVEFVELNSENDINQVVTEVKNGKIQFDIQKLNGQDSRIYFKTGTAVAAIRGTKGLWGVTRNGKPIGALSNGLMDITMGSQSASIKGGQAVVSIKDQLVVIDLNNAGDPRMFDKLDSLISNPAVIEDSLESEIKNIDAQFSDAKKNLIDSVKCDFSAIPDTIYEPSILIKGKCTNGLKVQIGAEKKISSETEMEFTPNWAPTSIGDKKFPVTCVIQDYSFDCGFLSTYYAGLAAADTTVKDSSADSLAVHTPLTILTSSPAEVCDPAAVTIEGTFDARDPLTTLVVKLGNYTSRNLIPYSAGGKFSHTINISDKVGNWNETKASVEYVSKIYGTETASIDLNINKTCKNVNIISPTITFKSADSLKCQAIISVENVGDDIAFLTVQVDGGSSTETILKKDSRIERTLSKGQHRYVFEVEDLAHNKRRVEKTLGCYPAMPVRISFTGGSVEVLRIPPPPDLSQKIYKTLRFTIAGIPQNNTDYIKRITISQASEKPVTLHPTDILSTSIDQQVNLTWGKTNQINVEVVLKNGKILKATKIYEFDR